MDAAEKNLSDLIRFQANGPRLEDIRNHRNQIVPFVGAGISKECGLYLWGELLDLIARDYLTAHEIETFRQRGNYLEYADGIVKAAGNSHMVMKRIREIFESAPVRLTESSYILASSFSDLVVTTNYDTILEAASRQATKAAPLKPLLPCLEEQMYEAIQLTGRCLLKLHGSLEETSSFILTSSQYNAFYGKPGTREQKPLRSYLRNLFSGRRVLFVGCSLKSDRTLEILQECVEQQEEKISHYAIVPWSAEEAARIEQSRRLTKLGIAPIYYPEGDYKAVRKLLCYLAEKNDFLSVTDQMIQEKVTGQSQERLRSTLSGVLRESYYETAAEYPELLDGISAAAYEEFSHFVQNEMRDRNAEDTLYSIFQSVFEGYVDLGYFHDKSQLKSLFQENFSRLAIRETPILELLKRRWSPVHILGANIEETGGNAAWLAQLSPDALNDYADGLLLKLQYKNGMSFVDCKPAYDIAKELEACAGTRLDPRLRTRLLNSLGAFSSWYRDYENGERFLKTAISLTESSSPQAPGEMLFLAKCYHNLALVLAGMGKNAESLEAMQEDIRLKKRYREKPQLYARSLNLYATLLKELRPFEAGEVYLEIARIKERYAVCPYDSPATARDMIASWATTLFNIGLLARDLELFDTAYDYVLLANKIRFQTVDPYNKDYCSSWNVQVELELALNRDEEAQKLVAIIDSKQNLPDGFSKIMGHTWYVCACYYSMRAEYDTAVYFAKESLRELAKNVETQDTLQEIKSKMALGFALEKQNAQGKAAEDPSRPVEEVMALIRSSYGESSYLLLFPYRYFMHYGKDPAQRQFYTREYNSLSAKYRDKKVSLNTALKEYFRSALQVYETIPKGPAQS